MYIHEQLDKLGITRYKMTKMKLSLQKSQEQKQDPAHALYSTPAKSVGKLPKPLLRFDPANTPTYTVYKASAPKSWVTCCLLSLPPVAAELQ